MGESPLFFDDNRKMNKVDSLGVVALSVKCYAFGTSPKGRGKFTLTKRVVLRFRNLLEMNAFSMR